MGGDAEPKGRIRFAEDFQTVRMRAEAEGIDFHGEGRLAAEITAARKDALGAELKPARRRNTVLKEIGATVSFPRESKRQTMS